MKKYFERENIGSEGGEEMGLFGYTYMVRYWNGIEKEFPFVWFLFHFEIKERVDVNLD